MFLLNNMFLCKHIQESQIELCIPVNELSESLVESNLLDGEVYRQGNGVAMDNIFMAMLGRNQQRLITEAVPVNDGQLVQMHMWCLRGVVNMSQSADDSRQRENV